jgi:hypothetical protein
MLKRLSRPAYLYLNLLKLAYLYLSYLVTLKAFYAKVSQACPR